MIQLESSNSFHFATSPTDMVTTRSRTGNSSTKKSGAATSSKAKSRAGRAAAQPKRATRSKKSQPTSTKETQQSKIGKNWKWQHSAEVSSNLCGVADVRLGSMSDRRSSRRRTGQRRPTSKFCELKSSSWRLLCLKGTR